MLGMAARIRIRTTDDVIRDLLVAGLPAARRLATYILRDPYAAEDAVQEAALLAWDRRGSLRDPDAAEAWFSRIVINVCKQELRHVTRRPTVAEIEIAGEDARERFSRRDELGRAIERLGPDDQLVLALRYGRDMTVPEIAAITGIRQGTVKSRLHGAREHLRAILDADRRLEESPR